jgi:hypothetical protein
MIISFTKRELVNQAEHEHKGLTPAEFRELKNRIRTSPRESFDVYRPPDLLVIFGHHKDWSTNDMYILNFGQYIQVCKILH